MYGNTCALGIAIKRERQFMVKRFLNRQVHMHLPVQEPRCYSSAILLDYNSAVVNAKQCVALGTTN